METVKHDVEPEDLVTLGDIADLTGHPLMTVRTWTHRYDDFPTPWKTGRHGEPHLYLRSDVEAWLRETGRTA